MTGEEINIKLRPVEEQRDILLEQNMLLTGKIATLEKENLVLHEMNAKRLDLQKENEELKSLKDVATLIRANNDTVITLMQLNNMLVSKSQQLTKAKEILQEFVEWANWQGNSKCPSFKSIQDKAEQFLKESE